ncbi:hypothetical protein [Tunturiibacter lichenicola]|uniref:hypothetical protein n=1 Tax=Tunturiibacter lichenicola TaxID=2051959 RepID=UPI003D9B6012
MISKALFVLLMSTTPLQAQQKIDSKGNDNTNVNVGTMIVVQVTNNHTTKVLKAVAKSSLGDATKWQGLLVPASDKLPAACSSLYVIPAEDKFVLNVRAGANEFECLSLPCNIVRTDNVEFLKIDGKVGAITVEAKVLDKDGNIIVSIEKNKFYVNRNRTYRSPVRDDASSLKVFDEKGNTVLDLRYANRKNLLVQGFFRDGPDHQMTIYPDKLTTRFPVPGGDSKEGTLSGVCSVSEGGSAGPAIQTADFYFGGGPLK